MEQKRSQFVEWCDLILNYIKTLVWPIIVISLLFTYHTEIRNLIKGISSLKIGPAEIQLEKRVEELGTKLKEKKEKKVPPEDIYAVVKTFKEFQNAIRQGRKSKLGKYFSKHYSNRDEDIRNWSELSKKEFFIEVKDVGRYGDKIKASIKGAIEQQEWEDSVTLIKEDNIWKFSE